jgi:hypothetical protein
LLAFGRVDKIMILSRDDDRHYLQQLLAHYDVPAYVRRARQVEEAFEQLLGSCRLQREKWLRIVRLRLGEIQTLADDGNNLRPWLQDDRQLRILHDLYDVVQLQLRPPTGARTSSRLLRRTLQELCQSIQLFNSHWQEYLRTVNLSPVNELRAAYNQYYLLEKECALGSPRLARQGFRRLEAVTMGELAGLMPLLPVPQLAH